MIRHIITSNCPAARCHGLFFCLLCIVVACQQTESNQKVQQNDLFQINQLSEKGKQFYDGPSDSLIFYFNQALSLIQQNLESLPENQKIIANNIYKTLKLHEFEAQIQLGIENLLQGNYSFALNSYFAALSVAEEMDDISAISECYGEIGTLYNRQGQYPLALEYQQKALEIARRLDDEDWIAICNNQIGNVYKKKAYYTLALKHYLDALHYFENTGQLRRVAACYQNIGDIYFAQKNTEKALDYYSRTLQIALQSGDRKRESDSYLLLGMVHTLQQNSALAEETLQKSLTLYTELGYRDGLDDCFIALGNNFIHKQQYTEASENFRKALEMASLASDQASIAEANNKLGYVYMKLGNLKPALKMVQSGLETASEIESKELQIEANKLLSELYELSNNYNLALLHHKQYSNLRDSIFTESQYRIISEMEAKYEIEKKEQDIALLSEKSRIQGLMINRRNRLVYAVGFLLLVSSALGYLYISNAKLKSRQKAVELENQLLRTQMNPHFIFNSLLAIQSFFYEHDPQKAADFLASFAELVRMTLENSRLEFVLLEKELEMIRIYLQLQALRFDNRFEYSVSIDQSLDPENIRIPPMLTQPFIENSIEHGLRNKPENGMLKINFLQSDHTITAIIEDNGIGREASQLLRKNEKHLSLAVPMIRERLVMLSSKFRKKFDMEIVDLYDESGKPAGTSVKISMPMQNMS
jgi:tetratricopeptide (TPR) repeat protein